MEKADALDRRNRLDFDGIGLEQERSIARGNVEGLAKGLDDSGVGLTELRGELSLLEDRFEGRQALGQIAVHSGLAQGGDAKLRGEGRFRAEIIS